MIIRVGDGIFSKHCRKKMALLSLDIVTPNVCMQRKCPHKVFAWQAVLELLSSSHPAFLDEMSARYSTSTIQSAAAGKGKKSKKSSECYSASDDLQPLVQQHTVQCRAGRRRLLS